MGKRQLEFALIAGVGLRVLLAIISPSNYDLHSYDLVASIIARMGNIYAETSRYNYSPLWFHLLSALHSIPAPLYIVVRIFLSLVDGFNGLLVGSIARDRRAAVAYLLNPVAIVLVGSGGQFETLAVLPLLVAIAWQPNSWKPGWRPWALATLALVTKHLVIFSAWTFLVYLYRSKRAILLLAASLAIFGLTFVPYLGNGGLPGIIQNVLLYRSNTGTIGFGILPGPAPLLLFLTVMLGLPFLSQRLGLTLVEAMSFSALALIAFIPGLAEQYWLLLPLFTTGLIRWYGLWPTLFTIIATVVLLADFVVPIPLAILGLNLVWLICLAWFAHYAVILFSVRGLTRSKTISLSPASARAAPRGPRYTPGLR